MKTTILNFRNTLTLALLTLFFSFQAVAQDNSSESHTSVTHVANTTEAANNDLWYTNPWVIGGGGAAILLIIIIAIASSRGSSSKSEVIRTTTTSTEVKND